MARVVNRGWFVFYDDDYADNGGIGFEFFSTQDQAIQFIQKRMDQDSSRTIENYQVIEGIERLIESVEVVTKIKLIGS